MSCAYLISSHGGRICCKLIPFLIWYTLSFFKTKGRLIILLYISMWCVNGRIESESLGGAHDTTLLQQVRHRQSHMCLICHNHESRMSQPSLTVSQVTYFTTFFSTCHKLPHIHHISRLLISLSRVVSMIGLERGRVDGPGGVASLRAVTVCAHQGGVTGLDR